MECYLDKRDICHSPLICNRKGKCIYREALLNIPIDFKDEYPLASISFMQGNKEIGRIEGIRMEESDQKKWNGSPIFYKLLEEMADIHNKKSHDYASNEDPYANYKFAGMLSKLFNNPDDAGFIGRIGEKLYRLANLDNNNKKVLNESIEDTERDIVTIAALWVAMRRERRSKNVIGES